MPTYVAGDVRGIQDYIFGSPRLLEMRGASALIDFFDRRVVPALVQRFGGETVYSGGGNFLASVASEARAAEVVEAVRNAFLNLTGSEGITLASSARQAPFPEVHAELSRLLRQAKRSPQGSRQEISMPFLKRCESCGRETADESFPVPGEAGRNAPRQWVGPVCAKKHRMLIHLRDTRERPLRVHGLAQPLAVPAVTERLRNAELPANLQAVAGTGGLALVVADGNGLGDWFEGRELEEVRALSQRVDRTLRAALDEATEAAFPGDPKPSLQVLLCGGDDLVVALPAGRALAFARRLLESFTVEDVREPGRKAGLAAGLLFTRPSFPFRQAHALADALLGRAKAYCRKAGALAALDFHQITATHAGSLDSERAAVERGPDGEKWSYGAAGPYTPETLTGLLALAGRLSRVTASQRGRLREILSPQGDGPDTPLHPAWRVPRRVVAELAAWLDRQDELPFEVVEDAPPPWLARERRLDETGRSWTFHRLGLVDALLLAEVGPGEA